MANGHFTSGNGRIAADLFDFRKHVNGTDFLHDAASISTSPGVGNATNVQKSIDNINDFIESLGDIGTSFMAIPDGYNCYTNPAPNYYFSNTIPSLSDFLIPLFDAIYAGSTMPSGYDRLQNGGILYIPAGTYYLNTTVSVPPSIIMIGEGYATKIINATSLDLSVSPPQIDSGATNVPMFIIKADLNRAENDESVDAENQFMFSRSTKLFNLTIGDNFIEPTLLGDVYYRLPQNTVGDCPLIMQEQGSHLELHNIKIIGRALTTTKVVSADGATRFAVKLDTVAPSTSGTILKINDSFIDGFSLPISFNSTGSIHDFLEITNSKIRSHGYLDNDGISESNNCIINMNDNNAVINSNILYGNHIGCYTILYVSDVIAVPPLTQDRSKILINGNDFIIDEGGGASVTIKPYVLDSGISSFVDNAFIMAYGNSVDSENGFSISVMDSSNQINIITDNVNINSLNIGLNTDVDGGIITLDGAIKSRTKTVSTTPYAIDDDGSSDYIILLDLTTIAASAAITLPIPTNGRTIIIKDRDGLAFTYNIIVSPNGSELIEGLSGNATLSANYGSYTFIADGTNWYLL